MKINRNKIGLILLGFYVVQYFCPVKLVFLEHLQNDSTYRIWSGLALFLLILHQWLLPIYRAVYDLKGKPLEKKTAVHNWVGSVSPLVFFLHSTKPDYGLLFILAVIFFLNLSFGLLNFIDNSKKHIKFYRVGIAIHILLSVAILLLTLLHIWLVFYYN